MGNSTARISFQTVASIIPLFYFFTQLSVAAATATAAINDKSCNEKSPEAVVVSTHDGVLLVFI